MKEMSDPSTQAARLRRQAEVRLKRRRPDRILSDGATDPKRLLHELQVHQIELETQNLELHAARNQLEETLDRYTDLYDLAPVGYLSLDEQGLILEINLAAATMLGMERSRLIDQPLQGFVVPGSRPTFSDFLRQVFAGSGKQICVLSLLRRDGTSLWADIQATAATLPRGKGKWCRVAISDISALKAAEEAQRRSEDLSVANGKLQQEIARRQVVETALKQSEEHQRRLLRESGLMQEQLRHLSHQLLRAQEEERKRISRDLHDQVAQTLVGLNVHLAALTQAATVNAKGLRREIARTQRLIEESVEVVHRFARELRPTLLDDLGLIPALHSFMKDFSKRTGIRIRFTSATAASIAELDNAVSTVLYRVGQEALANVAKHSQARQVRVALHKFEDALQLEVIDDGVGFDMSRVLVGKRPRRLGVLGMKERVQMVGGKCVLESTPGRGTTVRASVPLRKKGTRETPLPDAPL